ncbi:zinc-binding dehydrogenase [Piscinibacter sakaiensis]|uniref:zinc-binding dehydrogenase n=1 Tax=Piscinibacter sakaiensis TaxID=1547922 RepID=UPI00372D3BCE
MIATARSDAKRAHLHEQGADHVLPSDPATLAAAVRERTDGRGVDLALDPVGAELFIACLHALAPHGLAVSYNVLGGPPSADVFATLRALLGHSLAVRTFSMHAFDADPERRRALMQAAIEALASGRVRAPRAAPDTVGKLVLRP